MRRRPKTAKSVKPGAFFGLTLYYFFSVVLYIVSLPLLIYLTTKQKYKQSIPARFFLKNNPPLNDSDIWFHSCSLGETKAILPLAKRFNSVGFSAITQTGYDEAAGRYQNVRFLPFEIFLPFWVSRAKVLVVMEAELWLLMFASAKLKGVKTSLINARISDRSYPKYLKFRFFYRFLFSFVDCVFAQTETDKNRLESLGAKNVVVSGNIKQFTGGYEVREITTDKRRNFVAASTHPGEEELALDAFQRSGLLKKERLIIVPRHPDRFEYVADMIKKFADENGVGFSRFSEDGRLLADIVLVDKMGELINIYAKSHLVVLGGAFAEVGGHNPLEPAYFGTKLISGTNIFNQKASFEKVKNGYFCAASELADLLASHEQLECSYIDGLEDSIGEVERGIRLLLQRD